MGYQHLSYSETEMFCRKVFESYGFSAEQSVKITNVLLDADLSGIESHGIQRLVRYHQEIEKGYVKLDAKPEILKETPLSATVDGHDFMGQLLATDCMELAIKKAKESGVGMVTVRNSNHYGIAGYYTRMAVKEGLIGICMTNTEAIMVPTFGRQAMLGTNPIAFSMPATPIPFTFDAATTVVPRGKLEVYAKREGTIRDGWALDETGQPCNDATRVLQNIIAKTGGGILPLGGAGEVTSGYKGYGFAMLCEICTAILSDGITSNYCSKTPGRSDLCHFFMAVDYGMFGDKTHLEDRLSTFMRELRDSDKAEGQERIFTHGEKEWLSREKIKRDGIPVNEKTYAEMSCIADLRNCTEYLPKPIGQAGAIR